MDFMTLYTESSDQVRDVNTIPAEAWVLRRDQAYLQGNSSLFLFESKILF